MKIRIINEGEDFMFRLTEEEMDDLRCKIFTSSWGCTRYLPYAFTEQGIYMLMTVLKGELAVKQSKALIRTFKQMKDYIVENQGLISRREFLLAEEKQHTKFKVHLSEHIKLILENM